MYGFLLWIAMALVLVYASARTRYSNFKERWAPIAMVLIGLIALIFGGTFFFIFYVGICVGLGWFFYQDICEYFERKRK